ncbi:MAG: ASPIC/UnbV domain-containing protein [Ignavibacteriota bacterium]
MRVYWSGQQQLQEVLGGSGFCAQNDRALHFGLGKAAAVDRVEVRWPSGKTQTVSAPAVNQRHKMVEP